MYVYIYDSITAKKKYNKTLINIEKKITDLGLTGKIIRLEGISNAEKIIQDEIKYGAKTVIAIGNDHTLNTALSAIMKSAEQGAEIPALGIIPLEEKNNSLAKAMGIKGPLNACDVLLARRVEEVTVAGINNSFFLSQLTINSPEVEINIAKNYSIEMTKSNEINIVNFPLYKNLAQDININPKDKILELLVFPTRQDKHKNTNKSVFSLEKLTINRSSNPLTADNCLQIHTPAHISTTSTSIELIVGKNRNF